MRQFGDRDGNEVRSLQADTDLTHDKSAQALRRFGIRTYGADALEAPPLVEAADERIQDGLLGREGAVQTRARYSGSLSDFAGADSRITLRTEQSRTRG